MTEVDSKSTSDASPSVLTYATPARRSSETLATIAAASATFAVVSLLLIGSNNSLLMMLSIPLSLMAVIIGAVSLVDSKRRAVPYRSDARGACWVGAVILTLWLLGSLLLPDLGYPKAPAYRVRCSSNLKQIGTALIFYANDYKGVLPPNFGYLVSNGDLTPALFCCPTSNHIPAAGNNHQQQAQALRSNPNVHSSYVFVTPNARLASLPTNAVLAYERTNHHEGSGINLLFADGHVEWVDAKSNGPVIADLAAGKNPPPSLPSPPPAASSK